jgi:hypothetical protein
MITTLHEAHEELRKQITLETAVNLLADCQDFALQIGEFIENIEGEGTQTVSLLEEYCELVYQAGLEADSSNPARKLNTHLVKIENMVRNELKPNKVEVVFFPYQLSMWDSLESIYLAARDDPQCEAYVVPIPWHERRPDRSLGDMHYDGDQYPKNIPVMDWRDYNVKNQCPDVVFIHNPYDDLNFICSVHPAYYSDRLNRYTDLLCLCPYFVALDDITLEFAASPGAFNADRIIAQSEKLRAGFIREIEGFIKNNPYFEVRGNLSKKTIALGSPKFDKVINSKKEDFTIPDGWRRIIEKPNGKWKNIVLYNTSVSGMLNGNDKLLKKLRHTFEIFRNRDDAVLWWRPHPLSSATFNSMVPELANEYKKLVGDYKREGFGIYDDTTDLHRSLRFSSCLYGDATSISALYQCMDKPVMVHNLDLYRQTGSQTDGIDPAKALRIGLESITKAYDCAMVETADGITLEGLLDILAMSKPPEWYVRLLEKQRELKSKEIAHSDGTAGAAIWEYCKNEVLR